MKKLLIVLLVIIVLFGIGGAVFRSEVSSWLSDKKGQAIDFALKNLSEQYPIPANIQSDIKNIAKNTDSKIIMEFLKDPKALMNSKTEGAMSFVNSSEGKRLMEYYNKYMKNAPAK